MSTRDQIRNTIGKLLRGLLPKKSAKGGQGGYGTLTNGTHHDRVWSLTKG